MQQITPSIHIMWYHGYMENSLKFLLENQLFVSVLIIWSFFWKGIALWKSARKEHISWFCILLLVNTLGVIDIAYIFYLYKYELGSKKLLAFLNKQFKRVGH